MDQDTGLRDQNDQVQGQMEELLHDESFLQAMMDRSKRYMLIIRPDGVIVKANKPVLNALNKGTGDIEGKHLLSVPEVAGFIDGDSNLITRVIGGEDCTFETDYPLKNGKKMYLDCALQSLMDRSGEPTLLILEGWNVTDLKESIDDLREKTLLDELTNLPNRRYFRLRLMEAVLRAERMKQKLGVFFLDLDGFKSVNDSYGHHQGDFILLQVSHRLKQIIRGFDLVARIGGDEFLLLLEGMGSYQVMVDVCSRLLSIISKPFSLSTGKEISLTASIGVSIYPDDSDDIEKLVDCADTAMYRSKSAGKNCFHFYNIVD